MQRTFTVTVDRDSSSRWLVASVEQLPGCVTQAKDFPSLDVNLQEAVDAWLHVFHQGAAHPPVRLEWQLDPKRLAGVLFSASDPYSYTLDRPVAANARIQPLVFMKLRRNTYWGMQRIALMMGFHWVHAHGDHHVFRSQDGRLLVMPRSHTDWLAAPMLRRVLSTLGVSPQAYERLSRPALNAAVGLPASLAHRWAAARMVRGQETNTNGPETAPE